MMKLLMTNIPIPDDLVQLDDIENIADIEYEEIYRKKWAVRKNISSFFIKNPQKNKII